MKSNNLYDRKIKRFNFIIHNHSTLTLMFSRIVTWLILSPEKFDLSEILQKTVLFITIRNCMYILCMNVGTLRTLCISILICYILH